MVQASLRGVSDRDVMTLSPWELWGKYRVLPLEAGAHMLAFVCVTVLVIMVNSQLSAFYRFNKISFEDLFLQQPEASIIRAKSLIDHFRTTVDHYYNVNMLAVQNFKYATTPMPPVRLKVDFKNGTNGRFELTKEEPMGPLPLDPVAISGYLEKVDRMTQSFTLITIDEGDPDGNPQKTWDIDVVFDHSDGDLHQKLDVTQRRHVVSTNTWGTAVTFLVLVCSTSAMLCTAYRIVNGFLIRKRTKARFESIPGPNLRSRFKSMSIYPVPYSWSALPLRIRLEFLHTWSIYSFVGDACVISACLLSTIPYYNVPSRDHERLLLGIGALVTASRITAYLEIFPGLYTLIYTLKLCAVKIVKYLLSILPLYIGFIFCGDVLFGPHSGNFSSSGVTAVTLFALLNGDDIHGVFQDLDENYPYAPYVSRVYLFLFVLFWINAILNVCIFIIEDAFHLAKLLSAKYRMSDEELPGTYQVRYETEWRALQRNLDLEKLFFIIDAEAPHDDQNMALYTDDERLVGSLNTLPLDFSAAAHMIGNVANTPSLIEASEGVLDNVDDLLADDPELAAVYEKLQRRFTERMSVIQAELMHGLARDLLQLRHAERR